MFLIIFEHETIGLKDSHIINETGKTFQGVAKGLFGFVIEILVLVIYPLLNYTACYLLLVVVESKEFSCLLVDAEMNIGNE